MAIELIQTCFEQKYTFTKKLLELSNEIFQLCSQEDLEKIGSLLQARATYMQRIDKCNQMIHTHTEQLEKNDRDALNQLLSTHTYDDSYSGVLSDSFMIHMESINLLMRIQKLNDSITSELYQKRTSLLSVINDKRTVKTY